MSTMQETEIKPAPMRLGESERPDGEGQPHARRSPSPQRGWRTGGDVVLTLDGRSDSEGALEHSLKLAKTYGARIALLYVTKEAAVPQGYAEYARVEKLHDYSSIYFNSLGAETMARLRRRIEEEGVECTEYSFIGSMADAIKACRRDSRVLMLVLTLPKKQSRLAVHGHGFNMNTISSLGVPVVLVPGS